MASHAATTIVANLKVSSLHVQAKTADHNRVVLRIPARHTVQMQLLPSKVLLLTRLLSLQLNPKAPASGQDSAIHCRVKT